MKLDRKQRLQPENWAEFWRLLDTDTTNRLILLEIGDKKFKYEGNQYAITIDSNAVRHVRKGHDISNDDFALLEKIVMDGKFVYDGIEERRKKKHHKLKFTHNGFVAIMVVRIELLHLALKTMYKKSPKK